MARLANAKRFWRRPLGSRASFRVALDEKSRVVSISVELG
jgi:hypothetical protein